MNEVRKPRTWYVEALTAELQRISALRWQLAQGTGYRSYFKGKDFDSEDAVEICADDSGTVLQPARKLLDRLRAIPTGAGDNALTAALLEEQAE